MVIHFYFIQQLISAILLLISKAQFFSLAQNISKSLWQINHNAVCKGDFGSRGGSRTKISDHGVEILHNKQKH